MCPSNLQVRTQMAQASRGQSLVFGIHAKSAVILGMVMHGRPVGKFWGHAFDRGQPWLLAELPHRSPMWVAGPRDLTITAAR